MAERPPQRLVCSECGIVAGVKLSVCPNTNLPYKEITRKEFEELKNKKRPGEGRSLLTDFDSPPKKVETFKSGATRSPSEEKPDYEGFLSPWVVERFGAFMHKHRFQRDGQLRASDNWQKGIPLPNYMKSLFRHVVEVWKVHREKGGTPSGEEIIQTADGPQTLEETLCAIIFNAQGYLHEILKGKKGGV